MKNTHNLLLCLCLFLLVFSGCRKEETELIEPPEDETLALGTAVVNSIKMMVSNDGSTDNIIDKANCLKIKFPIAVLANAVEIEVANEAGYEAIEDVFDEFDDDRSEEHTSEL